MATERLFMRKTREILRQKWALKLTHRAIAASLSIGLGTVSLVMGCAEKAQLDWATVEQLADDALDAVLYVRRDVGDGAAPPDRPAPDPVYVHTERRKPGVTLELLHHEYLEQHPTGYRYTQFCDIYRRWLKRRGLAMRQEHRVGDKLFVDYSGKKPHCTDARTGEHVEVELFVAVLGASNLTYVEVTRTQRGPDFISSHVRALDYIGGVPAAIVPDQLKSGVTTACRYEPNIQRSYEDFAEHYGTSVLPARPAHPRDKAKVEVAVQIAQRWILARLRRQTFFSLDELGARIAELLEELNGRRMRIYQTSRRELFERIGRAALRALPAERFVFAD